MSTFTLVLLFCCIFVVVSLLMDLHFIYVHNGFISSRRIKLSIDYEKVSYVSYSKNTLNTNIPIIRVYNCGSIVKYYIPELGCVLRFTDLCDKLDSAFDCANINAATNVSVSGISDKNSLVLIRNVK